MYRVSLLFWAYIHSYKPSPLRLKLEAREKETRLQSSVLAEISWSKYREMLG